MENIIEFKSKTIVLAVNDIDTDQIIPARYLTVTTKEGLGEGLFSDWRFDDIGNKIEDFPLNQAKSEGCTTLIAGSNFGCGSSREHAPWALVDYGFKAIISTSFADIFRNNSLKNGLLPITVSEGFHKMLIENEGIELTISLEKMIIQSTNEMSESFNLEPFSRYCLMNGIDQLGFIMSHEKQINEYENKES
jgi:3-isopropylmalate/(R)-2-methylmalate dehydratase small subunit